MTIFTPEIVELIVKACVGSPNPEACQQKRSVCMVKKADADDKRHKNCEESAARDQHASKEQCLSASGGIVRSPQEFLGECLAE